MGASTVTTKSRDVGGNDNRQNDRQNQLQTQINKLKAKGHTTGADALTKKKQNEAKVYDGEKTLDKLGLGINQLQTSNPSRMQGSQDQAIIRSNIASLPGMSVTDSSGKVMRSSNGAAILTSKGQKMLDQKGLRYGNKGAIKASAAQEVSQMKLQSSMAPIFAKPIVNKLYQPSTIMGGKYKGGTKAERAQIEKDLKLGDKKLFGAPKGYDSVLSKNMLLSGKDRKAFLLGETEKLLKNNLGD